MQYTLLLPALLAAAGSVSASPLRRQAGSDGIMTMVEVVTDIVYVTAGDDDQPTPISTSSCSEETDAATTAAASTNVPAQITTGPASSAPYPVSDGGNNTTQIPLFATAAPSGHVGACPQPLTVGMDGKPILIGLFGGITLSGCTFTSTVTSNPLTLISDSALLPTVTTTAATGAGTGSTAALPAYLTAITSSPFTSVVSSGVAGEDKSTVTSNSIHALFTTPTPFASAASTLTKVTAAPVFGASLVPLSVLATLSSSLPAAQTSGAPSSQVY